MIELPPEALQAFIADSHEHLEALEHGLLALEAGGAAVDAELINTIFRAAHTIKGGAGFFAFTPIQRLAHAMENVLDKLRAGDISSSPELITALMEATSVLADMVGDLDHLDTFELGGVIARVEAAGAARVAARQAAQPFDDQRPIEVRAPDGSPMFVLPPTQVALAQWSDRGGRFVHFVELDAGALPSLEENAAVIERRAKEGGRLQIACATVLDAPSLASAIGLDAARVATASDVLRTNPPPPPPQAARAATEVLVLPPMPAAPAPAATPAPPPAAAPVAKGAAHRSAGEPAGTIRVNVTQLDRLMTLAGELVLTRNALLKKASERDLDEMIELSQRVDAITSDLQDGIMATRMQPVGIVFTKFRRIVRDLSISLGKKIELTIEGEEVELDKTIIEAIGDPLTHLVRNSADHGLELPEQRALSGKNERGSIALRAYHEAGQVVIEVADDGRGIDPERIVKKALDQRLRTREQLEAMSDEEKIRLIFEPGFSTAAAVTDISGRGVGMDVVQSSITKVGGSVDVRTSLGRGTTMVVRLPLTLAIIPSILVGTGTERFAIPQVNLVELVRIPARDVDKRVERVGSAAVMRLRGELLPLLKLSEALDAQGLDRRRDVVDRRAPGGAPPEGATEQREGSDRRKAPLNIAVVASGSLRYGLVVDQLLDSEEIVVKPLGVHMREAHEYAGATILGDGTVALILDVAGLGAAQNLAATKAMLEDVEARKHAGFESDIQSYLVFENGADERFAVPLGMVSRIERRPTSAVVSAGGRATLTLGSAMLGLLSIEDVAKVSARAPGSHFHAIVCRVWGREVGLMASRIVDVIEAASEIDVATHVQPGVLGSMVVDGHVILLVDIHGIVDAVLPEYRKKPPKSAEESPLLLVVEDSPFFRKQILACLHDAGYRTVTAEDGVDGLAALEEHPDVKLVVSDIEMPRMDGLEMTRRIREGGHSLPIFAVTTVSGDAAERRGREAGITEYMIKLDREQLVERVGQYLGVKRGPAVEGPRSLVKGAFE